MINHSAYTRRMHLAISVYLPNELDARGLPGAARIDRLTDRIHGARPGLERRLTGRRARLALRLMRDHGIEPGEVGCPTG